MRGSFGRAAAAARTILHRGEGWLLTAVLAAMAALPLVEFILRSTLHLSLPDSARIVQHLVLVLAMVGGAVAAREGRLLALSTAPALLRPRLRAVARLFSSGFAAGIALALAAASYRFCLTEKEVGAGLAYGVPLWVVELVLPVGFFAVGARLLWRAADRLPGKLGAALFAAAVLAAGSMLGAPPKPAVLAAYLLLLAATVLGAPIFTVLGGAALISFWGESVPTATIPVEMYRLVVSPTFPTIPLFTLAGYFLAEGGASRRLVRVFQAWFGWLRGGPAIVTVLVCAFFTSFTGASGVTILALGGLLMPVLLAERFSEKNALGMITAAGSLGLLFPPSLPVILYGVVSHTPIDQLFLGGILPGFILVGLAAWWGLRVGRRSPAEAHRFSAREGWAALWEAKWELALPVVVLVGIFGGFVTLVEAATLTALYAFIVEIFLYRDLNLRRDLTRVMTECGILVGGVLLILGVALGFTSYLVDAEVPARLVEWTKSTIHSRYVFLLGVNAVLLVVGCLMDIFSAIIVVVPLLTPTAQAFGVDPVHLGIIFLANLELGFLTPPVGMNLFLSSYRFGKPMPEVYRSVVPMLLVLLVGVLIITYVPAATLALPRWFLR